MALVPRGVFRNWWDEVDRFHREVEEHFQLLTVRERDPWQISRIPSVRETFRPWRRIFENLDRQVGGAAIVERNDDKYQVIVDVQQFAPEEVTVRTDDRCITVEARHGQRKDNHGYISREFIRRYLLPRGYDIGHVKPSLSSDGILTITAPRLVLPAPGERIVPVRRTYLPAIKAV
ncbi:protein lethal(2)essential for life [Linepithema humile]|uniref:protein lethal(2)essential for life n=1 Tax=Linepithema humile TaxID=83485 RepID=UPI0006233F1E|nr:PREDICTED: protein lethal(2)essential for life-like [Linepithema humile]